MSAYRTREIKMNPNPEEKGIEMVGWHITSDNYSWVLQRKHKTAKGVERITSVAWFPTLGMACRSAVSHHMKQEMEGEQIPLTLSTAMLIDRLMSDKVVEILSGLNLTIDKQDNRKRG